MSTLIVAPSGIIDLNITGVGVMDYIDQQVLELKIIDI